VIDAPALVIAGAPNTYVTLGLTPGAVNVEESEEKYITSQEVTGGENLTSASRASTRTTWGSRATSGTSRRASNPTAAQLTTAANWVQYATSTKQIAGVRLITQ
jgi:hypothetical protein